MENINLADLRRDYSLRELSETTIDPEPFAQFSAWFDEYLDTKPIEPNAMILSTVDSDGRPSSRVVLLKGFSTEGFVFFTNYESKKASDLEANPAATLHFYWPELERQVNIRGSVKRTSREESEAYFALRPVKSRIGAWASKQSSIVATREALEKNFADVQERFEGNDIPCPPFWGGFRVTPDRFEFWQGRRSRLHDRICYEFEGGGWKISRLSP